VSAGWHCDTGCWEVSCGKGVGVGESVDWAGSYTVVNSVERSQTVLFSDEDAL